MSSHAPGTKRVVALSARRFTRDSVCRSCRAYGSAAAAEAPTPLSPTPPVTQATSPQPAYQVHAGVVLSRPPQITRALHPFEKSYFLYQRRLNERLALPFTRYFYIRKDTPADFDWKRKIKSRLTAARDIGAYNAYAKEGWNDELLVGAKESEPEHQVEALVNDAEITARGDEEDVEEASRTALVEKPASRVTEADETNDVKSLNRLLQRTLYLVVKNKEGRWMLPSGRLLGKEGLHRAAERIIVQGGGTNMNTWVVGNAPIGYLRRDFKEAVADTQSGIEEHGERVFFMKARIFAGQADMTNNQLGLTDYQWLAKEELQQVMSLRYFSEVRNMLAER